MPRKKIQPANQNTEEKAWQVVKERVGVAGSVLEIEKIGIPVSLENAKQILIYKNTTELRQDVRYRVRHVKDL